MSSFNHNIKRNLLKPLGNIGSGVLLKVFKPFSVGDFIEIDGKVGSIEKRGLYKTTLKKIDGSELRIENDTFYRRDLHNLTSRNIISLDMTISVSYQSNMARVKDQIMTFVDANIKLLDSPKAKIQVTKIKNDAVELSVKAWCLLDDFLELDAHLESKLNQYLISKNVLIQSESSTFGEAKMLA